MVRSGDWSTSDAFGYLVITGRAGGNFSNGTATSSSGSATLIGSGVAANSISPGGRFRFRTHSFSGSANDERVYAVNGISSAFEFDQDLRRCCAIILGVATRPTHLAVYANRLLLGYDAGNVLVSEIGYPLAFKAVNDAAEINFGSNLTGMLDEARRRRSGSGAARSAT